MVYKNVYGMGVLWHGGEVMVVYECSYGMEVSKPAKIICAVLNKTSL